MPFDPRKTPYYLINLEQLNENYNVFKNAIEAAGRNDIIAYSVKANYNPAIIGLLDDLGAFFEVCSAYEYRLVLRCGVDRSHIIVNGCFFDDPSDYSGSIIILDTLEQIKKWVQGDCKETIGIRVNADCFTIDGRFKNKTSRFGVCFHSPEIEQLLKQAKQNKIVYLHCHLSGNNREPSIYRDIITQLQSICEQYHLNGIKCFDVGGGFKIEDGFWRYADYINAVDQVCRRDIQIIFEPGNSLVRNCAEYHTKIVAVKKHKQEAIYIVDGTSLHIPTMDRRQIHFRFEYDQDNEKKHIGTKIYGNTCKESDLILKLDTGCSFSVGDCLIIENVGAYSIDEVDPLILGHPNVYYKNSKMHLLGNRLFCYVCNYKDCYHADGKNNYSTIKDKASQNGLYAFVHNDGTVLYIGAAYDRGIYRRVIQHFRNDSGGLRRKLSSAELTNLESSALYIYPLPSDKRSILLEEAFLIGMCRPTYNYRSNR